MAVLAMSVLEIGNRQMSYNTYNQLLYEKNSQMMMTYMDYIENIFDRMEQVTYFMIGDMELQRNLTYLQEHTKDGEWLNVRQQVGNAVSSYSCREKYFSAFLLVTEAEVFGFGNEAIGLSDDFSRYKDAVKGANGQMRMISGDRQLMLVREIRQSEHLNMKNLAYVIAQVDFSAIIQDMEKTLRHAQMPIDISVYDGKVCLYSGYDKAYDEKRMENGWYMDGEDFVTVYNSKKLGYTMIVRTPYGELNASIRAVYWRSVFLSFLIAAVALVGVSILIKMVVKDLYGLVDKMDEFGAGKLLKGNSEERFWKRTDEVGKMYRHFYRMASDYSRLMEEDYSNKLRLKEAEFLQLQKQIQPHFLFNTLTAISWMAYAHDDVETANMTEALGRMMRMVTDNSQPLVTVGNDLQMVEDYLFIQKFRFRNRLHTEISIHPQSRDLMIPRISIQPLVENSVTYVMEEQVSDCRIKIFDRICETHTEIIVEDNGRGFPEDILVRLGEGTEKAKGSGLALHNINKRLQYTFSEAYGLQFHRLEHGMQVILRIPNQNKAKTKEREESNENRNTEGTACR